MGEKTEVKGVKDFNDYCPFCSNYQQMGVCSKIHINVKDYPNKFVTKCSGEFFETDGNKTQPLKKVTKVSKNETLEPAQNGNTDEAKIEIDDASILEKYDKIKEYSEQILNRIIDPKNGYNQVMIRAAVKVLEDRIEYQEKIKTMTKECPACLSPIPFLASKCKFCGETLVKPHKIPFIFKPIGFTAVFIFLIILVITLGFFHIVPPNSKDLITIFPKAHFSYSYTFVDIDEVVDKYNNRNLGQMLRGDEVFDNLHDRLLEKGIIVKSGKSKEIDW